MKKLLLAVIVIAAILIASWPPFRFAHAQNAGLAAVSINVTLTSGSPTSDILVQGMSTCKFYAGGTLTNTLSFYKSGDGSHFSATQTTNGLASTNTAATLTINLSSAKYLQFSQTGGGATITGNCTGSAPDDVTMHLAPPSPGATPTGLPVAPQGTAAPTIPPATPSPAPPQNAVPSLAYQHALSSSGYTQLIYGDQLYNGNPSSSGWSETIPASGSKITLITSLSLSSAGTVTAYVGYSASSSCTSPTTQGGPYYLSTAAGFVKPQSLIPYWKIPGGDYGCIDLSASVSVGVDENFAQM